jgi:hypothetical protein
MRLALLAALPVLLTAAPAGAVTLPVVKVRTSACQSALSPKARSATFTGDMRGLRGATRLQMRFVLQARTEDKHWAKVAAPGFGTWASSDPGIGRYVYAKTVELLAAPADYRAVVDFRWLGASGRTVLRTTRTSRLCRQPDLRPDLEPQAIVALGDGRFAVTVRNSGRTAAGPFAVTVEAGDLTFQLGTLAGLGAGEEAVVEGQGPACSAEEPFAVTVDPDDAVDESEEDGNVLAGSCPQA